MSSPLAGRCLQRKHLTSYVRAKLNTSRGRESASCRRGKGRERRPSFLPQTFFSLYFRAPKKRKKSPARKIRIKCKFKGKRVIENPFCSRISFTLQHSFAAILPLGSTVIGTDFLQHTDHLLGSNYGSQFHRNRAININTLNDPLALNRNDGCALCGGTHASHFHRKAKASWHACEWQLECVLGAHYSSASRLSPPSIFLSVTDRSQVLRIPFRLSVCFGGAGD